MMCRASSKTSPVNLTYPNQLAASDPLRAGEPEAMNLESIQRRVTVTLTVIEIAGAVRAIRSEGFADGSGLFPRHRQQAGIAADGGGIDRHRLLGGKAM